MPRIATLVEVSRHIYPHTSAPMTDLPAQISSKDGSDFEALGNENGERYWWQSDLCGSLGYQPGKAFDKAVGRAMAAFTSLAIPTYEGFRPESREIDGHRTSDVKLSRFACYLVAMNGDPGKPEVARAQQYFAIWAEAARQVQQLIENVDRVVDRDELTDREKSLSRVAKGAGVDDYALFRNAGYRGLYNMNLNRLKQVKGIPQERTPLDFMGKEELAANLFRITQTEGKIRKERVTGQRQLQATAESVGRDVRNAIQKIGGTMPEDLEISQDIKRVRSGLKETARQLKRMDKPKLPKRRRKPDAD